MKMKWQTTHTYHDTGGAPYHAAESLYGMCDGPI